MSTASTELAKAAATAKRRERRAVRGVQWKQLAHVDWERLAAALRVGMGEARCVASSLTNQGMGVCHVH
jgi:hypothetical protein